MYRHAICDMPTLFTRAKVARVAESTAFLRRGIFSFSLRPAKLSAPHALTSGGLHAAVEATR